MRSKKCDSCRERQQEFCPKSVEAQRKMIPSQDFCEIKKEDISSCAQKSEKIPLIYLKHIHFSIS